MSVTESKVKTPVKTSKKAVEPAAAAVLKAALDAAQIEMVPLLALVKSPLNVRIIPYSVESVRELAGTIERVGLLQNLVVHSLPEGLSGVAAGGRRLTALQLLVEEQRIDAGYRVAVKRVSDELAVIASMIENEQHKAMHPAEQINGFRRLSVQGKTPAQIGDQLGYGSRHVQRMLKLANLAPELLAMLADDKLDVEQCQALCLENDPARQVEIYGRVKADYSHTPAHLLKRAIIDNEISVRHPRFVFIGRETYEAAGGVVREDLFSAQDGDGTADGVLVDRLVQQKLDTLALALQLDEGWSWSQARETRLKDYGDDREHYLLLPVPEVQYTDEEQQRLAELFATQEATETFEDEAAVQALIDEIENTVGKRAWMPEQKAACGVVVSLYDGELCVQRGVQKKVQDEICDGQEDGSSNSSIHAVTQSTPDVAEGISAPLLKKMSSERTLAVQAAMLQQPQKAVAMLVWRLCTCVFADYNTTRHPFVMRLEVHHNVLTSEAPTGKEGKAWQYLMQEKARLEALLPEGWEKDFTTFFTLNGQTLMDLMALCTAFSIDGVQTRMMGHTPRSDLDDVETALGFHLRDWWQPTAGNFLGLLTKNQIVGALTDAGLAGAASDTAKMKKDDAASHAEQWLASTRWVPVWMQSADAVKPDVADDAADTDDYTAHAA